ncbi:MAG: porin [Flavobacterium sp.]|nr:porin [Flavobacterium sp.]
MKLFWKITIIYCCFGFTCLVHSQENSAVKIDFSGYVDLYYLYNFNQPTALESVPFLYNYNRHNEFNSNISLFRTKVSYQNYYANIALQSGTYVESNYANEKIKYLNEAFIGVFLDAEKKNILEVGILPSYIGFESATTSANITLTRSILAENSPYFMAGVKLNRLISKKVSLAGIVSNGWQKINKPNRKALPSFGAQLVYKPSEKSTLNWSTFIGDEPIEDNLRTRYFSNLFWDYKWSPKWHTITGFDIGYQKKQSENNFSNWYSPVFITQYELNKKWQTALRLEYYQDKEAVLIGSKQTLGTSINFDYLPNPKVKFRCEAKYYNANEPFFMRNNQLVRGNFIITTSLSFEFL